LQRTRARAYRRFLAASARLRITDNSVRTVRVRAGEIASGS
jgi:hypothetical protein